MPTDARNTQQSEFDTGLVGMQICIATVTKDYLWYDLAGKAPVQEPEGYSPECAAPLKQRQYAELEGVTLYRRAGIAETLYGCYWVSAPTRYGDYRDRPIRFRIVSEWSAPGPALEFAARLIEAAPAFQTQCNDLAARLMRVGSGEDQDTAAIRGAILAAVAAAPALAVPVEGTLTDSTDHLIAADTPENRALLAKALRSRLVGMDHAQADALVAVIKDAGPKGMGAFAWRGLTTEISREVGWTNPNPPQAPTDSSEPKDRKPQDEKGPSLMLAGVALIGGVLFLLWLLGRRH